MDVSNIGNRKGKTKDKDIALFTYLGTPRKGSGVTEEFLTTPDVFAGAGETMLLG